MSTERGERPSPVGLALPRGGPVGGRSPAAGLAGRAGRERASAAAQASGKAQFGDTADRWSTIEGTEAMSSDRNDDGAHEPDVERAHEPDG